MVQYEPIDYQDIYYYAAPKAGAKYESIDDVPKEILETYEKLGIPLREAEVLLGVEGAAATAIEARTEGDRPKVAVDAVFDSVSVATTFREELKKAGVIFMSREADCGDCNRGSSADFDEVVHIVPLTLIIVFQ